MIAALTTAALNRFNAFTFAPFDSRPSPPPYSAAFVRHSCLTNTFVIQKPRSLQGSNQPIRYGYPYSHPKGTMTERDEARGRLLDPTPFNLHEEEVAREGVRVRRVASLARAADGRYLRWIARRVSVGRGEGSSGLAFDSAEVVRPR